MKKISIMLILSGVLMLLVSAGWSQVIPLTKYWKQYTVINRDATGTLLAPQSEMTIQLVLINNTTLNSGGDFGYDGVDPVTGIGIRLFSDQGSDDAFWAPLFPGDVHVGAKIQVQGFIEQYYNTLEFVPSASIVDDGDENFSVLTCLGGGFAIQTTLIPSIASATSVDTTALTGGQSYLNTLVQLNNLSLHTTEGRYTTQIIYGQWTTSGSIGLIDASIGNVTTVYSSIYPNYSSLTIFTLDMPASEVSTFRQSSPSNQSTFFAIVTAMPFNLVGAFDQNSFGGPATNPQFYWIYGRGASLGADVTPYIAVSPTAVSVHPGGSSVAFTATGGFPPYTWSLSNYAVGTIDSSGNFSPSSTRGTTNVIVTDQKGYTATVVGVVTNTATSAPLAPDISMGSMTLPRMTDNVILKPSEE